MKKFIFLVLLLTVVVSGTFALDKNIGFGPGMNFAKTKGNFQNADWTMNRVGMGGFIFFGISRFIELNLGFLGKFPDAMEVNGQSMSTYGVDSTFALQAGIYGKIPITLGSRFVFFPTAGADFEFTLGENDWWHELWLRAGLGADIFLSRKFFIRAHALGGFAFPFGGEEGLGLKSSAGFMGKLGFGWML